MFDLILVADWSATSGHTGRKPRKDAIWVCADLKGEQTVEYFPTRSLALAWIDDWLSRGYRTLVGFDFAMGYPAGFATTLTGRPDALAVWDWLAERIEDGPDNVNNRFAVAEQVNRAFPGVGPLWGRPASQLHPDLPERGSDRQDHGVDDRRTVDAFVPRAQSVLKLYTAGSVGSQSLVGLAALAHLRRRHPDLRVWPQETGFALPESGNLLVEIYPSLFEPAAHDFRDAGQVIATARALREAPAGWFTAPSVLPDTARVAAEEGWILGVLPPSSCFALPPGADWTPVDVALDTLRRDLTVVTGIEDVTIVEAAFRILARDVVAVRSNPPEANAAVDGWAFAHDGLRPGGIPIVDGRAAAGRPFEGIVPRGEAIRILTGAVIPKGADTVALQEDAMLADGLLHLKAVPRKGANTRRAGEDVCEGDPVLRAGGILRPTDVALAIAAGHGTLPVRRRLRVGVLSTGDEIVAPGEGGGIPDVNRPMLLAIVAGWDFDAVDLGRAPDEAGALAATLDAADVDAILTSGGASAGDEDHLSRLLRERGGLHHWRIAIKPGRPLALGHWNGTPLFGLPGNPVAAFTCAALFARPALFQMAGAGWRVPVGVTVPAAFSKSKKAGRREVLRARLRDGRAEIFRSEGSGLVSGLSWAEGFVELPDRAVEIAPGDLVRYIAFAELGIG
ncbi:molybdopterin-binding protein [Jannaschia rubra]|uniref:Molybdopterin molybdenumtransferase n=1 Tax=Jannaschia rubra TaxID=282197 RepID=A0A0M6XKI3_9RHOB|nr:molybdopterin-binding protein [Jannaschia rubra]CTQ31609.1 Molybdopterin molybdenumtransferase [Jannaschia rubra]SFF76374.1 molybdopterin molybdotransferase [Jannaschia rubra]